MNYLLDTIVVIGAIRNRPTLVRDRLAVAFSEKSYIAVSTVSLFELWYGVQRSPSPEQSALKLKEFFASDLQVLPFSEEDAPAAGQIRARLGRASEPIGPYEVLIAAQALRNDLTLVTSNVSEFSRVPGLRWENWAI